MVGMSRLRRWLIGGTQRGGGQGDDDELEIDEQSVTDIDVPEQEAEQAKGGMTMEEKPSTARSCTPMSTRTCN
jgi:hypothetical protein